MTVITGYGHLYPFNVWLGQPGVRFVRRARWERRIFSSSGLFLTTRSGADLLHTINEVPFWRREPFFVTFESYLPRVFREDFQASRFKELAWARLKSANCKGIFAMSEYARRQFGVQNQIRPDVKEVMDKIRVRYPCVEADGQAKTFLGRPIKLLFVGRDFIRKGGSVVVQAHRLLAASGANVETTIVSSLDWRPNDYVGPSESAFFRTACAGLGQEGITHHRSLPGDQVRDLMKDATFTVIPTFHDTFGFAPMESIAMGTPIIVTDTCAQPEIIGDPPAGLVIPLENDAQVGKWVGLSSRWAPHYADLFVRESDRLAREIANRVSHLTEHEYLQMSQRGLDYAAERFDRSSSSASLMEIYERALS